MTSTAIDDMVERGLLRRVDGESIDAFLGGEQLQVLFFVGAHSQRGDNQDVAVALREILKDYPGQLQAALVDAVDDQPLQARFRVLALPSLVLTLAGETLEVIPRVRDWGDYVTAFRRYLGERSAPASPSTSGRSGRPAVHNKEAQA